jgi:chromosome segregation ATPase
LINRVESRDTARHTTDGVEPIGMGLGGATRKLQKVADMGEELYSRISELREQMLEVSETVQETNERVAALENKVDGQAAILEALAQKEDIDVNEILTEVAIEEAESATGNGNETTDVEETIPDAEANAEEDDA